VSAWLRAVQGTKTSRASRRKRRRRRSPGSARPGIRDLKMRWTSRPISGAGGQAGRPPATRATWRAPQWKRSRAEGFAAGASRSLLERKPLEAFLDSPPGVRAEGDLVLGVPRGRDAPAAGLRRRTGRFAGAGGGPRPAGLTLRRGALSACRRPPGSVRRPQASASDTPRAAAGR